MNPIQRPVEALLRRLTILHGLLYVLALHVQDEQKRFRAGRLKVTAWTALPFVDMSTSQPALYVKGKYQVSNKTYIEALEEVLCRNSAMTISQGYEAFETYLIDTLACYLHVNPSKARSQDVDRFRKDRKSNRLSDKTYIYWRAFAKFKKGGDNGNLLKTLRQLAPDLRTVESGNNLCDWYAAVSEVRHSVTHQDFFITPEQLAKCKNGIFSKCFPVCREATGKGYRLKVTRDNAELALKNFASYGHSIFKHLSIAGQYNWDLFERVL
jgi:hypothetical protein